MSRPDEMREPEHWGESIRMLRRQYKGLTQEKMAEIVGVSVKTYQKIERGEVEISPSRFYQISKVFTNELAKNTAFVLDERVEMTPEYVFDMAMKALKRILLGGK
jgi:transcriptional regulator with XRE-family HTH domain